jgi:hypothetical protein
MASYMICLFVLFCFFFGSLPCLHFLKFGMKEIPVAEVCEAFKVARGMVQALQENAGRFASMVSVFCERLGWNDLEGLVAKFQNRVSFGVRAEIVELTTIPYVKVLLLVKCLSVDVWRRTSPAASVLIWDGLFLLFGLWSFL